MNEMTVERVAQLREQWQAEGDARRATSVPIGTLLELTNLVLRQAEALKQLDHGLSLLEDLFSIQGNQRRDDLARHYAERRKEQFGFGDQRLPDAPAKPAWEPGAAAKPVERRRHARRH